MSYFFLKYMHILGACILFGTGLGIAFFMFMSVRTKAVATIVPVLKIVVIADYLFTLSAAILQPVTGLLLVWNVGYSLLDHWVMVSLLLYGFIGLCWVPVVFMQIEMRDLAEQALIRKTPLPERFYQLYRRWLLLGWPAFLAIMIVFLLMIEKPDQIF